jgi:hypothetical protein
MRTKISGLHTNEVFFRDTAHGFLAWAFATLISATALASATAYLANGALAGLSGLSSQSAQAVDPAQVYVDMRTVRKLCLAAQITEQIT